MVTERGQIDDRVRRWWVGFGAALLLLLPLDLLTTFASVSRYGIGVEANPVMRWLLSRGLFELTVAHLAVVVVAVAGFDAVVTGIERAPATSRARLATGVEAWLALIVAAGVLLVAHNLLVLV